MPETFESITDSLIAEDLYDEIPATALHMEMSETGAVMGAF